MVTGGEGGRDGGGRRGEGGGGGGVLLLPLLLGYRVEGGFRVHLQRSHHPLICELAHITASIHKSSLLRVTFCSTP